MSAPADQVSTDLTGPYQAYRDKLASTAAGDELLSRIKVPEPEAPKPSSPVAPGVNPIDSAAPDQSKHSMAYRAVADVAKGTTEIPRAIIKGFRDSYQNVINLADDVGNYATEKLNLPGLSWKDGELKVVHGKDATTDALDAKVNLPDINAPTSVTGGLVKNVAQFLASMKGVDKALNLPKLAGPAGYTISALKGALANFAGFDPHQGRLSDLIEKFPALHNPVTDYLSSKPDDSNAEGRFKNALEGTGLGVLTDGFFKAIKLMKNANAVRSAAEAEPELATAAVTQPEPPPTAMERMGNPDEHPNAPFVSTEPVTGQGTGPDLKFPLNQKPPLSAEGPQISPEDVTKGSDIPGKTFINFNRIEAPEDIERAMQELADRGKEGIDTARRGTQTFEQIKLNAAQQDAWRVLESRRIGDPLNAEQSVAARELWATSADKLREVAQLATRAPTEENLFAFRKMLATHYAIQQQAIGARTETARALASWRIPVGTSASKLEDINWRLLEMGGGKDNVQEMAQRVLDLSDAGMANELDSFVQKSAYAKTRDAVIQAWTDGLLTSPVTQAKILASNASTSLWRMGERAIAAKISSALGTEGGVAPGEVAAQWAGLTGGWRDALAYAWKAAKTGTTGEGIGEPHEAFPSNISSEALGLSDQGWLGKGIDYLSAGLSLGRRGIAAQHDAALTLAYRMELHAQAVRQATEELNAGLLASEDFGSRVADILQNPPPHINMASIDQAKYQAFLDEPGKIAQWLLDGRQKIPELRFILPFIKIPARIFSYTMERTPLAPLMSSFRENIAQGGPSRDLALAQTGLGTAIMLSAADLTMQGRIKGQGPAEKGLQQAQEREGEKNWSVKVGNRWYDLNGVHPIGKLITLAASATEAITNGQHELKDDADTEKIAVATTLAIAANLSNSSYTQGLANFFAVLHDSRTGGTGESALFSTAGSAIPSVVGTADRAADPYQRAVYSMLDEFKSRIPGLSSTLPPRRDLWGDPVPSRNEGTGGVMESLFSPAKSMKAKESPIDNEILKQGFNLTLPSPSQSFGSGARIDLKKYPEAYSRFLELAGHEWKSPAWGVGAKELMNSIVSGEHPLSAVYQLKSDGPDGGKEIMIRDLMNQYREGAKRQLLEEFPKLAQEVSDKQEARQALKMPVMQ